MSYVHFKSLLKWVNQTLHFMRENLQSFINLIKVCQDQFQTLCRKLCKIRDLAKDGMMGVPTFTKALGHKALG